MKKPAIILDFGAVILNINFQKTIDAFADLGIESFEHIFSKQQQAKFMQEFEMGNTNAEEFRAFIQHATSHSVTEQQIDDAWNALLLDYPTQRIELLQKLKETYPLYLLSNTNSIHHQKFQADFTSQFGFELDSLFLKAYYSHEMRDRKPNASCYQQVLSEQQLQASETIFIDDTLLNVEAANKLGIHGIHLTEKDELTELLPRILAQFN